MIELLPISFTFSSLAKVALIIATNFFLGYTWYSPIGFQKQWIKAMQWKDGDEHGNTPIIMSNIGTLLSAIILNILLIAFDIRKHQYMGAMLAAAIICGFYAVTTWNYVFFAKKSDYQRQRTLYFIDIGFIYILYTIISLILVSF